MVITRNILTVDYDKCIISVLGSCNHYKQREKISKELSNLELNVSLERKIGKTYQVAAEYMSNDKEEIEKKLKELKEKGWNDSNSEFVYSAN